MDGRLLAHDLDLADHLGARVLEHLVELRLDAADRGGRGGVIVRISGEVEHTMPSGSTRIQPKMSVPRGSENIDQSSCVAPSTTIEIVRFAGSAANVFFTFVTGPAPRAWRACAQPRRRASR